MKSVRCFAAVACVAAAVSLSAQADIVTFNGLVGDGGQRNWGAENRMFYDEAGYRISVVNPQQTQTFFLDNDIHADSRNVDDDYLFNQNSSTTFQITRIDGAAFTFKSMLAGGVFGGRGRITIQGALQGGGNVNHVVSYVPGGETGNAFVLYNMPAGFSNPLTSVTITRAEGNFAGFDDFSLNEIPAPGALAVLALGLAGTARRRRG